MYDPLAILREANRTLPETKYLWIVLGIAAVSVVVKSLSMSHTDLISAALLFGGCIIIFGVVLSVYGAILRGNIYGARILATIVVWTILLGCLSTAGYASYRYVVLEDRSFLTRIAGGKPEITEEQDFEVIDGAGDFESESAPEIESSETSDEVQVGEDELAGIDARDVCIDNVSQDLPLEEYKHNISICLE